MITVVFCSRQRRPGIGTFAIGAAAFTPFGGAAAALTFAATVSRVSPRGLRSTTRVSVEIVVPNSLSARSCVTSASASDWTMSSSGAVLEPLSHGSSASAAASAAIHPSTIG